jgi:hypothetical protein
MFPQFGYDGLMIGCRAYVIPIPGEFACQDCRHWHFVVNAQNGIPGPGREWRSFVASDAVCRGQVCTDALSQLASIAASQLVHTPRFA